MVTIQRVLLPTDFTEVAENAVPFARSLAERYGAALHVVHVCESVATSVPVPEAGGAVMMLAPNENELKDLLEQFVRERLSGIRVPVVTAILKGSRATEITRYAKETGVDLIVIGTHLRGVMNRIIFGSVSKSVLEHAHCPVLMVPPAAATHEETGPMVDQPGELLTRGPDNDAP